MLINRKVVKGLFAMLVLATGVSLYNQKYGDQGLMFMAADVSSHKGDFELNEVATLKGDTIPLEDSEFSLDPLLKNPDDLPSDDSGNSMKDLDGSVEKPKFKDSIPDWAKKSILRLNSAGILKGYDNGNFGANDTLTRGQVVTVLHRMLKYQKVLDDPDTSACNVYSDLKIDDFAYLPACSFKLNADKAGIGDNDLTGDKFQPRNDVTRGEVAVFIDALLGDTFIDALKKDRSTDLTFKDTQKDGKYSRGVDLVYKAGLMTGNPDGTFAPDKLVNRAEMAVIMDRTLNFIEKNKIKKLAKSLGEDKYLADCADLIKEQSDYCDGYENWTLDIQILKKDFSDASAGSTGISDKKVYEKFVIPPGNKCDGKNAGDKYPLTIKKKSLDSQSSDGKKSTETLCSVSCSGWKCPEDEAPEICPSGTMSVKDCLANCDGTCTDSSEGINCSICKEKDDTTDSGDDDGGNDEPAKNCVMPVYPDCRGQCAGLPSYPTFEFEDCLTACDGNYMTEVDEYNRCME